MNRMRGGKLGQRRILITYDIHNGKHKPIRMQKVKP